MAFVKERMAARFYADRQLNLFYPFRRVLDQLIGIRIASIKLTMWLGSSRTEFAVKKLRKYSRRTVQLLQSYRSYKEKERFRGMLERWLQLSQANFVKRKQYQLSTLLYKTHLQRKVFGSMIARTEDGRPLRHTIKVLKRLLGRKRCVTALNQLKKQNHPKFEHLCCERNRP